MVGGASIRAAFRLEGCAFAERLAQKGNLSAADAGSLLAQPASREEITEILLGSEPPSTIVTGLAADALGTDDYLLLSKLTARRAIAPERLKALLTRADPAFTAIAAASIFNGQHDRQDWDPGELEPRGSAPSAPCKRHAAGCASRGTCQAPRPQGH